MKLWRKSSLCDSNACVEVAWILGGDSSSVSEVAVRSSRNIFHTLSFTVEEWETFVEGVKAGEFDL